MMQTDVSRVFLNTDEHAETIVFIPDGKPQRTVAAMVFDRGLQRNYESAHVTTSRQVTVYVSKSETTGINSVARADRMLWNDIEWGNPELAGSTKGMNAIVFHRREVEASRSGRRTGLL